VLILVLVVQSLTERQGKFGKELFQPIIIFDYLSSNAIYLESSYLELIKKRFEPIKFVIGRKSREVMECN
jgi:hypothetical protein